MNLKDIRREYLGAELNENDSPDEPFELFESWFFQARERREESIDGTEFCLATASKEGIPSARMLLLKEASSQGFKFFTNYASKKGLDIAENPKGCMLFFWSKLARQVRISVDIKKLSRLENEEYFFSRPKESQISAMLATQSEMTTKDKLLETKKNIKETLCPPSWGGYLANATGYEFWQGQANRLHDRIIYEKSKENKDIWLKYRVAP